MVRAGFPRERRAINQVPDAVGGNCWLVLGRSGITVGIIRRP
jgi:hypothetical protein